MKNSLSPLLICSFALAAAFSLAACKPSTEVEADASQAQQAASPAPDTGAPVKPAVEAVEVASAPDPSPSQACENQFQSDRKADPAKAAYAFEQCLQQGFLGGGSPDPSEGESAAKLAEREADDQCRQAWAEAAHALTDEADAIDNDPEASYTKAERDSALAEVKAAVEKEAIQACDDAARAAAAAG